MVRYWLLTTMPGARSHSVGTETWPSKRGLGGVVGVAQQREAVDRIGSGTARGTPSRARRGAVTYDSETTSSSPARLRVITVRCAHGQNQPAYRW